MSGNFKLRVRFLSLLFFIIATILIVRLFFIQVKEFDFYSTKSDRQYSSYKTKESIALRGNIYFKEKSGNIISAAVIREGFLVAVNPSIINKPEHVCDKIKSVVLSKLNKASCVEKASKKDDPYEVVAQRLSLEESQEIKKLDIEGLSIFSEQWRFYPGDSLASQVLGFFGHKKNQKEGRYGVEQYYEDILRGEKNSLEKGNSFAMLFWELGKDFLGSDAVDGHDLVLTIEPRVQSILESYLDSVMKDWKSESAGGIIMNPNTGSVLAMASKPDFNSNFYNDVEDFSYFRNPLVADTFEMGSVVKPLTMAAAIDAGKVTTQTTYFDNGFVVLNGSRIENYDSKGRGLVDMQKVLNKSLNTGAIFVMQQMGKKSFLDYFRNYGLDEITGIDLPNESEGNLSNLLYMRDIEYATASFGQGIAMTPIEFAVAASALANGGVIMEPHVVDRILVAGEKDNIVKPVTGKQVLKKETSKEISRMLTKVVDEALLNGAEKLEHYSVAAKTGTAQLTKPKEEGGGYYEDQYFHSFFGYAPSFNPEFLIFLYVKKPQGVKYASHTLTDPFMGLTKFLLNYYEVSPDR